MSPARKGWLLAFALLCAPAVAGAAVQMAPHPKPDVGPIDLAMRPDGETTTPSGPIAEGGIAGAMPFRYLRTGVLNSDLRGRGMFGAGLHEVTTGAPGFFVGSYRTETQYAGMTNELWCFLPSRVGNAHQSLCVLMLGLPGASIAVKNSNPYWADPSVAAWPTGTAVDQVVIDERPVAITDTPVLEYRFLHWTASGARVAFLVSHRQVGEYDARFEADGSVRLDLLGGSYLRLTRDPGDPTRAMSVFVPTGAAVTR